MAGGIRGRGDRDRERDGERDIERDRDRETGTEGRGGRALVLNWVNTNDDEYSK
jgi:hypothetical protein